MVTCPTHLNDPGTICPPPRVHSNDWQDASDHYCPACMGHTPHGSAPGSDDADGGGPGLLAVMRVMAAEEVHQRGQAPRQRD